MPVVLVTGGAGFIGSHTVDRLMHEGRTVIVLDDLSSGSMNNLQQWENHAQLFFVKASVIDDFAPTLKDTVAKTGKIERIIHFAAQTAVPLSVDDPLNDISINLGGMARVLEYARYHGVVKVVFSSSSAVYDDDAPMPVSEKTRARPSSPYGINKLSSEFYLDYYARLHGVNFTALRFMNVYGPRQDPQSYYSGVISIFLDRAAKHEPINIYDDGEQTRDFVYASDVASAVCAVCFDSKSDGSIINIGTGIEVSINMLAASIKALSQSHSTIAHLPARLGDIRRSVTTLDAAREMFGFQPQVKLADGLKATYDWLMGVSI